MSTDTKNGGIRPADQFTSEDSHEAVQVPNVNLLSIMFGSVASIPQPVDPITRHDAQADLAIALLDAGDLDAALSILGLEVRP